VPTVPTAVPNVWDTRAELAAWANNGVSTGPATLVGDGTEAVIRVDVAAGNARLHGPNFEPPLNGVTGARIRYRLLNNGPNESIGVLVYLRPTTLGPNNLYIPELCNDLYKLRRSGGEWTDEVLASYERFKPPYTIQFAVLTVYGYERAITPIRGVVEIDSITLLR
jgi:hypothetical protein